METTAMKMSVMVRTTDCSLLGEADLRIIIEVIRRHISQRTTAGN